MSVLGEAPDPKAFKSWEDAFKYPIPATRRFQQQLKGEISSNRERLRTLVGGSYRDLLGTADSIIQMDNQMKEVEIHLGNTSRRCNTDRLNRSFRNASKLLDRHDSQEEDIYTTISELAVLQACPYVLVRVIRKHGSLLLAAKVLVIARRLYRTLKDTPRVADYAEKIWSRLSSLRQKLLHLIDQRLISPKTEQTGLINALCAFALATTSASAADLLRHFHRVRLDTISSGKSSGDHEVVLGNLQLWIRTLQDTRSVFQKPLVAALGKIKSEPILKDADIQTMSEFDLETHEAWLGEDIQNFIPYLRHDDLVVSAAAQQLSEWAPAALKALLSSLEQALVHVDDFRDVVQLRQGCLELLFSNYHIAGVRKDVVLNGFREAFRVKLQQLVEKRCNGLSEVSRTVEEILRTSSPENFGLPDSLWSEKLVYMDTSRGVERFMTTVHDTLHGFTPSIRIVTDRYRSWLVDVETIDEINAKMRSMKWEDHLDLDSDSDSEFDEAAYSTTRQIQCLLKESDPAALQSALSKNLAAAFKIFMSSIEKLTPDADALHAQSQAAFLLRVIREIKHHLPSHIRAEAFTFTSTARLHQILALSPISAVLQRNEDAIRQSIRRTFPASCGLWDGTPPLPTLPSPWTFKLLQDLEGALAEIGADLWMPEAVRALKDTLAEQLIPVLEASIYDSKRAPEDNGKRVRSSQPKKGDVKSVAAEGAEAEGAEAEGAEAEGAESEEGANSDGDQIDAESEGAKLDGNKSAAEFAGAEPKGAPPAEGAPVSPTNQPDTSPDRILSPLSAKQLLFDIRYLSCMDAPDSGKFVDVAADAGGSAGAINGDNHGASAGADGAPCADSSIPNQLPGVRPTAAALHHRVLARAEADIPERQGVQGGHGVAGQIGERAVEYRKRTALLFSLTNG